MCCTVTKGRNECFSAAAAAAAVITPSHTPLDTCNRRRAGTRCCDSLRVVAAVRRSHARVTAWRDGLQHVAARGEGTAAP
eukprot:jgi/Tetstr1/427045/TSEL_017250.t1